MAVLRPVILCGGSGTRLWPLSRGLYPKQFMDIGGETIFGRTLDRVAAIPAVGRPIVVCNDQHRFLAAAIAQGKGLQADIILESAPRNTAPAIAMAALAALTGLAPDEDALLLVLPSDHVIEPVEGFVRSVAQAARAAEGGALLTFGIKPGGPETGFGYIKEGEALKALPSASSNTGPSSGAKKVARFVEKPTRDKAEAMLAEGGYFWNSGMFLFGARLYLEELKRLDPEMYQACEAAWAESKRDMDFIRLGKTFAACPANSIDYAVMERTDRAAVVPLDANWSDLGSWEAFYESGQRDGNGNVSRGDVLAMDTKDSYLHSSSRLLTTLGVSGLCVVETPDAVLVLEKSRSQEVKGLLETLKKQGRSETDTHLRVHRPWGSYETLALDGRFQVKRIVVNPGCALSLQMHHHRAEHWVVVRGTAKVTVENKEQVDDCVKILSEDMSTYIPLGHRHRLENPGRIPLEIIEVQTGSYLGEDDIVRFEDVYGR